MPERRRNATRQGSTNGADPGAPQPPAPEREAPPKPSRWGWLKTVAGSAALAIVTWEAVRFYRRNIRGDEPERNPEPGALPPMATPSGPTMQSPIVPLPIPFPMMPPVYGQPPGPHAAPPAHAPAPAPRPDLTTLSARELSKLAKSARARERRRAVDLAELDLE